ncbi:sensor histidine kinase [Mariniflexile sp. AS56]|uniref:sensor histidine kinase n=1 Tax=Mariniflexile sp. AS56 TaxID=3063957 RepID=UPI0026EB2EC7|nr:ATP-binding protein [Mariniflexile sp. AS56]MDO7173431.1 ATP-binding protein [Mariniflexile sp. AS56]
MIPPNIPDNEKERIKNLYSYSILDTLPEADYDNLTTIAAELCGTPISLISIIDDKRQWLKAHHGLDMPETSREYAFCAHAINESSDVFIVPDSRLDDRFHDNPLVIGDPLIVFYAGVRLVTKEGYSLGTLCVIDQKPNILSESQISSLKALSSQVMNLLELRKNKLLLEETLKDLEEKNEALERFAIIAAHDLKSPLLNITSLAELFLEEYGVNVDVSGVEMLKLIISASDSLAGLIEGLLSYSRSESVLKEKTVRIDLLSLKNEIADLFRSEYHFNMTLNSSLTTISVNKTAISQVLINLVANAIKHSDKDLVDIELGVSESGLYYECYVKDNGPGIASKYQEKIFKIFEKIKANDKFGQPSNGIGLATVKKIVGKLGGSITLESELGQGAKFIFTLEK